MKDKKIYLSPPNVGDREKELLEEAIASGWVAPLGPHLDQFEKVLELLFEDKRVLALNSGTSALHLALILAGVGKGDEVVVGTFTFAACANVVLYQGAIPIFLDSEEETWNLDPELLEEYFYSVQKKPKAVIVTHLYGVPAKIDLIKKICEEHEVILIEDAAEAIGSKFKDQQVGKFGTFGVLSFNGNKLVTTSGGGALIVTAEKYGRGLHLATQASTDKMGYNHEEVGYNYRLSNLLAGVGLAQLEKLDTFIQRKREIFNYYNSNLPSSLQLSNEPVDSFCNRWLTTPLLDKNLNPTDLIHHLNKKNIQARRLWKPLHLHQAYSGFSFVGSGVTEKIFERGLCLPSGTGLTHEDLDYIMDSINSCLSSFPS